MLDWKNIWWDVIRSYGMQDNFWFCRISNSPVLPNEYQYRQLINEANNTNSSPPLHISRTSPRGQYYLHGKPLIYILQISTTNAVRGVEIRQTRNILRRKQCQNNTSTLNGLKDLHLSQLPRRNNQELPTLYLDVILERFLEWQLISKKPGFFTLRK